MHPSVLQRLWRGRIALWFSLCGCAQAASGPALPFEKQVAELPGKSGPKLTIAANDATTLAPVDATPSPDGTRIFYLAISNDGSDQPSAGVFAVDADANGAGELEELTLGAPLLTPLGIESSLDGSTLFIADTTAGADATGAVFRLAANGGTPSIVPGSEGYRPAGIVVGKHRGQEVVYSTGRDPESGAGAVFRMTSSGGDVQRITSFDANSEPGGVAIATNGDLYIADHAGVSARVLRVRNEKVSVNVFAWADSQANASGTVYTVKF